MEDVRKLLEQNEDYLTSSSDESDNELSVWNLQKYNDIKLEIQSPNSITSTKRNGEKRMPTRRPDPNVYNRNALLARENRRKKKVYLEAIEKELHEARKANHILAKALKRQLKVAKRLEQEKKYLEGMIANRSEILTLVNALNVRRNPCSKSNSTSSNSHDYSYNEIGDRPNITNQTCSLNDADTLSINFDSQSDDLDNGTDCSLPSTSANLDDIWGENGCHIDNLILPEQVLNKDHCYVSSTISNKSDNTHYIDVEGDCMSSDAFSSINNWNSVCRTPPLQLLSDHSSS